METQTIEEMVEEFKNAELDLYHVQGSYTIQSLFRIGGQKADDWLRTKLTTLQSHHEEEARKAVEVERRKIKAWAQSKKDMLIMKWDNDKAKSTVYDAIIFNRDDFPITNNQA